MKITIVSLSLLLLYVLSYSPEVSSNCGRLNFNRIVGGYYARNNVFPWQALMLYRSGRYLRMFCGGSLISNQWIVTAAHCAFSSLNSFNLYISLGNYNLRRRVEPFRRISQIIRNRDHNSPTRHNNDIALIRLAVPVTFKPNISPICLPTFSSRDPYINSFAIVSGYGRTIGTNPNSVSLILKYGFVRIQNNARCSGVFRNAPYTNQMVCATYIRGTVCNGDSGGPLTVRRNGRYELVGITSFGVQGCAINYPAYYASVPALKSWIQANTGISG